MLKVSPKEVESLSKMEPEARYKYFIKRIADQEEVVIIQESDGNVYQPSQTGRALIHCWCAEEFAAQFLESQQLRLKIQSVDFDYLGEKLYPYIESNNLLLNIMAINESIGHLTELADFSKDLKEYLDEWY